MPSAAREGLVLAISPQRILRGRKTALAVSAGDPIDSGMCLFLLGLGKLGGSRGTDSSEAGNPLPGQPRDELRSIFYAARF